MDQERVVSKMRNGWVLNKQIICEIEYYSIAPDIDSKPRIYIRRTVAMAVLSYISDISTEMKMRDGNYVYKLNK